MVKLIIRFPTLIDMLDFMETTDYSPDQITRSDFSIRGCFTDAEIELARNGMHGEIVDGTNSPQDI